MSRTWLLIEAENDVQSFDLVVRCGNMKILKIINHDPLDQVYEIYKDYMSKINTLLESPAPLITHDLWQAIKKAVGEGK
jgi:hypothetical protein